MSKDIPLRPLRIRPIKTRWGGFSPQGRVTLNLSLIKMPVDCLDYVILHELIISGSRATAHASGSSWSDSVPIARSGGKN
jgi:hypothetical protein